MSKRYRVLIGTHIEGGKSYGKDQVVESDHELSSLFRGKFEEVTGAVSAAPAPAVLPTPLPAPPPKKKAAAGKSKPAPQKETEAWNE